MPIRGVIGRTLVTLVAGLSAVAGLFDVDLGALPAEFAARVRPATAAEFVAIAAHPNGRGVYLLDRSGGVHSRGEAPRRGSLRDRGASGDAVDIVPTPDGGGYWIFDADGGVHTFGNAPYLGSLTELRHEGAAPGRAQVISAAATRSGGGYLVLDAEGGIFTFGDARFVGSLPGLRNAGAPIGSAPAVDLAPTPSGDGYLVLDAEGGIFTFGDARFVGSIPALRAAGTPIGQADVRDLVVASDGGGYWVTDAAGGIFAFGAVRYLGSAPELGVAFSLVGTAVAPGGTGYWMMDAAGRLLGFGTAAGAAAPLTAERDGPGEYLYMETAPDGSPVRFNPCRTVEYVVHVGAGAPPNALDLAAMAFGHIRDATGVNFAFRGTTGETFSSRLDRPRWNDPRYGPGASPVLVSFEAPSSSNGLAGEDGGMAGRLGAVNDEGRKVVVTAAAVINTTKGLSPDFRDGASYGAVLLHELGHVMGLDHVDSRAEIMSSVLRGGGPGTYQAGDLAGLAGVGTGSGCLQDPGPR